jgi:hypothetical protein
LYKRIERLAQLLVLGAAAGISITESLAELGCELADGDEVANAAECRCEAHRHWGNYSGEVLLGADVDMARGLEVPRYLVECGVEVGQLVICRSGKLT